MTSPFKLAPKNQTNLTEWKRVLHLKLERLRKLREFEESYLPGEYESGKAANVFQRQIRKFNNWAWLYWNLSISDVISYMVPDSFYTES